MELVESVCRYSTAIQQKQLFDSLSSVLGSSYAACMYLAKKARNEKTKLDNLISESEALTWALTNKMPKSYELRRTSKNALFSRVEDILNYVDDNEIREAAKQSFRDSVECEHLIYSYMKISDESRQSRVRVLTRMMFYKFKEDNEDV